MRSTLDETLKFALDIFLACAGLFILSPLLILLAVVVKLDSPGSVLYRRRVMGRNGTQFDAYKFRTMSVNGDEILAAHPELRAQLERDQKIKDDPRITRSGRLMRKLSLDEFPQFINVARGQMSLVGPRMISPPELTRYGDQADELLTVRPGITGPWQISGRSNLSSHDRVRLDVTYAKNRTFWSDLKLLILTVPAVITGRGAY